jgi:CheY-like chemotaxis protein
MKIKHATATKLQPCAQNRILVVDDDKSIRDMFHRLLCCGVYDLPAFKIDLAVNGAEAVESFRTVHQTLLLMDLQMPVMDGERAFREVVDICTQNRWEEPSVIFFTGFDPPQSIVRLTEKNDRYCLLRKPIAKDALLQALRDRLKF